MPDYKKLAINKNRNKFTFEYSLPNQRLNVQRKVVLYSRETSPPTELVPTPTS